MEQFGVQFYQASLTARDVDRLVRFEVLSYTEKGTHPARGARGKVKSKVNWELLERRIAANEKSYQRQIIRKKIDELVQYYEQCREARNLPSIPGAVIISSDEPLKFEAVENGSNLGMLKVPEREGILRAIDGQHRLLALHSDLEQFGHDEFHVPAVIFDRLPEDHVVQMFVTINAKHTRLNPSHLVSLAGKQLYSDPNLATAHDVVRALNDRDDSPLEGQIKLLGVGTGRVAQAPLAQELKRLFEADVFGGPKKERGLPRGREAVLRQLLQAGLDGVHGELGGPEVQHPHGAGAARVHPRRARRGEAARSGARRPHRLPRHRPCHRSVGAPHRRRPLRDGRRVEAQRRRDRSAREGTAAGAAVSGRGVLLAGSARRSDHWL